MVHRLFLKPYSLKLPLWVFKGDYLATNKLTEIDRMKMRMIETYDVKIHHVSPLLKQAMRSAYITGLNDALDWVKEFNIKARLNEIGAPV